MDGLNPVVQFNGFKVEGLAVAWLVLGTWGVLLVVREIVALWKRPKG